LRADMRLGNPDQLARISSRYGFEKVPCAEHSSPSLYVFGENIFLLLLLFATNPTSMRRTHFWRERTLTYLSRRVLERSYGAARRAHD
jgi:hypothetical protein